MSKQSQYHVSSCCLLIVFSFFKTCIFLLGADPDAVDADGISALGWACLRSRIPTMVVLLDKGATIGKT